MSTGNAFTRAARSRWAAVDWGLAAICIAALLTGLVIGASLQRGSTFRLQLDQGAENITHSIQSQDNVMRWR